mgnify:CR=1 FL=1
MYAEFTDDLVTGNTLIDSQHKELIDKIDLSDHIKHRPRLAWIMAVKMMLKERRKASGSS